MKHQGSSPSDLAEKYSYWFRKAYPNSKERGEYLRDLVKQGYISAANFRLAHLLSDGRLARIAVTPNFDDYLTRALRIFGKSALVCDHPQTTERVRLDSDELQLIHLHGTYLYYDCCNLAEEIQNRAAGQADSTASMASLLDSILRDRSPIVMGYSGWESDAFMSALRRRLNNGPLAYNMHWFCYRRESADRLPAWLDRMGVCVTIPDEGSRREPSSDIRLSAVRDNKLPAIQVLDELVRAFGLGEPLFTQNPFEFLASQWEKELLGGAQNNIENDRYGIRNVIEGLRKAASTPSKATCPKQQLDELRDVIRRADHAVAVELSQKLNIDELSDEDLQYLYKALYEAAMALEDTSELKVTGYRLALRIIDRISAIRTLPDELRLLDIDAASNLGKALFVQQRWDEEIEIDDRVISRYEAAETPEEVVYVALAMVSKGIALTSLGRSEEAIRVYRHLIASNGDPNQAVLLEQINREGDRLGLKGASLNLPRYSRLADQHRRIVNLAREKLQLLLADSRPASAPYRS